MEIFNLINVLTLWSSCVGLGLASQQPGISIIALVEIENRSITYTPDPHVILPKNTAPISLRCEARFPVMWTIESLEGKWVNGTTSQRIVGSFHDPTTYEFSMTLKLAPSRLQLQGEQKLECVSVAMDGPSTAVSLKRDALLGGLILSLGTHPSSNISRRMFSNSNPNITLSVFEIGSSFEADHKTLTCRVRAGAWPATIFFDLEIGLGVCDQPLMCLTPNYKVEADAALMHKRRAQYVDHREVTMYLDLPINRQNPRLYTCQARESGERAHLLAPHDNSFARLQLEIERAGTTWTDVVASTGDEKAATIYVGDTLRISCQGSPFLYASGALHQFLFKNETETLVRNEIAGNPQNFEFSMPVTDTNLTRISCHFPPWNSTEWVTVSLAVNVGIPSPPVSASSAATTVHQNVTFFSHQSTVLDCDFMGVPTPEFKWNVTSDVYSMNWKDWNWFPSNGTLKVSQEFFKSGGLGPIPAAQFVCTAYNMAGNATKYFNIQATRSFVPAMDNNARQAVVMYTGDRDTSLNCSLSEGVPAPLLRWERHGVGITNLDNCTYEQRNHGDLQSELAFRNVSLDDEAEFVCIATNFLGSARKEFSVRIRDRSPGGPTAATATAPATGGWLVTIVLILLLGSVAFVAYRQVKQNRKIRTLATVGYSRREAEEAGEWAPGVGAEAGNLLGL